MPDPKQPQSGSPHAYTAAELAARLGGYLDGASASERVIRSVAPLDSAGPDDLSWIGSPQYLKLVPASGAGVILAGENDELPQGGVPPQGRTVIRVADPDAAVVEALALLAPDPVTVQPGIHPTAVVADEAVVDGVAIGAWVYLGAAAAVGAGTQLHPGVYVGDGASIGRDAVLWPGVVVRERVSIGDRVIVHPNTTIGADGFGYLFRDGRHKKIPQIGTVVIEDDVEIGANSAIDRARSGVTRIGRGTKLDNLVQIAHNCDIGEHCVIAGVTGVGGSTTLGRGVIVGGGVAFADHLRIGAGAQIAARAFIVADVAEGEVVGGIPAVPQQRWLREQAALRRLPELIKRSRELEKRVEALERAAKEV